MSENRKKDISREYIKENVLNKDLVEIQESLQELKDDINTNNDEKRIFGLDNLMDTIFNNEGDLRSRFGFNINKLTSIMYMMISNKGRENLNLLYNELEKSKSESELRKNLGIDLQNLEMEVLNNNKPSNNNQNNYTQSNYTQSNYNTQNNHIESTSESKEYNKTLNKKENYIVNQAKLYGITDNRQIAYILATVKGECGFKNIKEIGGQYKKYGKDGFYGRGYVQLTHKGNYEKFTDIIKKSGLNFKDNSGNVIIGKNVDLVKNPDLILQSNDLAAFILVYGMKNGIFTGKSLDDYIKGNVCDYENARRIVNGTDHANQFAKDANKYLNKLGGKNKEKINNKNLLIGPELLAKNRDGIYGLGNSIMFGVQGGKGKSEFKNFNGVESKNTKNHPDGFKSENDVVNYIKNNPGIKSFMFYFGGNTSNNKQTLGDINKWAGWFNKYGVQPVLCTCIGVDTHLTKSGNKWLISLNKDIKKLGEENNWPVIDFSKIDNNIPKSGDKVHPTGSGYKKMRNEIDKCLA